MNATQTHKLRRYRGKTLEELRKADPKLAAEARALMRDYEIRERIRRMHLPAELQVELDDIDFKDEKNDFAALLAEMLRKLKADEKTINAAKTKAKPPTSTPPRPDPLGTHPAIAQQLAAGEVQDVAGVAGLTGAAATTLQKAATAPGAINDASLSALVTANTLTADQATSIGFAASVYQLAGNNAALAKAIVSTSFPALGGKPPTTIAQLATLGPSDWQTLFQTNPAALPAGVDASALGAGLSSRFTALRPSIALLSGLPPIDSNALGTAIGAVKPGTPLPAALTSLINTYPGLQLDAVVADSTLSTQAKVDTIVKRAGFVSALINQTNQTEMLELNLASDSPDLDQLGLSKLGATADEQQMVLKTVQAYQRTYAISSDPTTALSLLQAGFQSSLDVGKLSLDRFTAASGLQVQQTQGIWERARASLADSSLTAGSIIDIIHGISGFYVGNQSPSAEDYLKQLAGFQDLFGNLSMCSCQECQSILGPAAYFVDLMKFIDENLRVQFPSQGLPLDLKTRRPDLWTLELSCDNTNNLIALLDIVNPVLENYIAQRLGYAGSLTDRASIETLVYKETLATTEWSVGLPFTLPLARLASYMGEFQNVRSDIANVLGASANVFAQAELNLSTMDVTVLTTPDNNLADQSRIYGIQFTEKVVGKVDQVDASVLGPALGLTREELGALVATWWVGAGGANVSIFATKLSAESVQNDVEWVQGLTVDALDRMGRFTRLMHRTGWAVADQDLLFETSGVGTLSQADLVTLAQLHVIIRTYQLTEQEAAALIGPMPQVPAGTSLFDQTFNPPSYVAADGAFPQPTTHFVHPSFRQNTPAKIDPNLPRLLSGLGVTLEGLAALAVSLSAHLAQEASPGFNPNDPVEDNRYFVLSAPNLTLLYRHASLANLLNLAIPDLFELLSFLQLDHVATLSDLISVIDLCNWYESSGYQLDDIAVSTGQTPSNPAQYPDPPTVAAGVVTAAQAALKFSGTMFALSLGTTEQGSADIITSNPALIESVGNNAWQLIAGIDLSTAAIVVPASATVPTPPSGTRLLTADEIRGALTPYVAAEVLVRSVGNVFNVTTDKVSALSALAGQSLIANALVTAVRGDGPIAPLQTLIAALVPLATAFSTDPWDANALAFVAANPNVFGAGPLPALAPDATHPNAPFLTLAQLRGVSTYSRLAQRQTGTAPNLAPVDPADIQSVLTAFNPATPGFPPASDAAMARVLNVPVGLVVGLRPTATLPTVAAPALDQFDRAAQTAAGTFGVDGETFAALISSDYDSLLHAGDALLAVVRSRITDQTALNAKLDLLEQPVREAKRDALAAYLINAITPQLWTSINELYEYFLIDVAAGGCEETSLVVSATLTAQLYVYRALMNLEQDDRAANDPKHFVLTVPAEAAAEWEWRKNYRVWQANREVFLWPENYMVPDLRDDKTPLFTEIEQELLQTSLTDQDALDAYTKYLAGLNEVANLTIAGAYHEMVGSGMEDNAVGGVTDVLHLFGCTADDPPVYYYRTCQNLIASQRKASPGPIWSPWQKVSVQMSSRRVAPVMHFGRLRVFWTDIKTRPKNTVSSGASEFAGYTHKMSLFYTTLRADGTWTAPQQVRLPPGSSALGLLSDPATTLFGPSRGEILDPIVVNVTWTYKGIIPIPNITTWVQYDPQQRSAADAIDDYTLSGPNWEGVWPYSWAISGQIGLELSYRNFMERHQCDLFGHTMFDLSNPGFTDPALPYPQLLCAQNGGDTKPLFWGVPNWMPYPANATANLVIDERRLDIAEEEGTGFKAAIVPGLYVEQIATIPSFTGMIAVPGSVQDGILQVYDDVLYLQGSTRVDGTYVLTRIGTTLVDDIARRLFQDGIDAVLDIKTQLALAEAGLPITLVGGKITDKSNTGQLDFKGAYGTYYREIFLYLPWLIANAHNANGNYESSNTWYKYIFDPTANEAIDVTGLSPAEAAHRILDRVWRYREFRGLDLVTLRSILTDPVTIALYKQDPFNPWAIARRRISAFQKAIVMATVGNLLDWADSLFTQFLPEPVNEAMMLYIMASDILGPRPVELGDCGAGIEPDNYANIGPLIDSSSDILIELETWMLGWRWSAISANVSNFKYVLDNSAISSVATRFPLPLGIETVAAGAAVAADAAVAHAPAPAAVGAVAAAAAVAAVVATASPARESLFTGLQYNSARTQSWGPAGSSSAVNTNDVLGGRTFNNIANKGNFAGWAGRFGWTIVSQLSPVFCVPANDTLLGYWDRLEDRLYKIRHCEDIDGNLRQMPLFAPPINPMQLVAMEAEGLSLDDVLGTTSGNLPPYRFSVLIERAKSFAATLSGFGAALLSALERKDNEQISRLRLTQQMNLTQMTTKSRQDDIDAAQALLDALNVQLDAANYRSGFYDNLISQSRSAGEYVQTAAVHTSSGIKATEATLGFLSAAFGLIPQVGSPFAMKYGGVELHANMKSFADSTGTLAAIADAVGASSGLEANFDRRTEGWKNLKQLADYDVHALNKQITAAALRLDIANEAYKLNQKMIDQTQQMLDLADSKFTNLGRYTWLAAKLQLLYRTAYQNALGIAVLTQQAYRFERGDDTLPGLSMNYWDPTNAGLLAGEGLLMDLQSLERRFLETNYRTLEIDQPFSLSQIDPQALIDLRETGECQFTIPEAYINLFYPGIYNARIKGVRLTIPCVTGPYVNVSATLTMQDSWIRPTPTPGAALVEVPPSRSISVAMSTAQNDAGVFELSFRDERYMPFEGLGAISSWDLRLPKTFRPFDYQTMNDVVLSISYLASLDGALRDQVEQNNATVAGSIVNYFTKNIAKRAFSLRQDFSSSFTRLLRSPLNTAIVVTIAETNMPLFVRGRKIAVTRAALVLNTADGAVPGGGFAMSVDGNALGAISLDPTLGNLPAVALPAPFAANLYSDHTFAVTNSGSLAPAAPPPGDTSVIDASKLLDVLIYLEYKFQ